MKNMVNRREKAMFCANCGANIKEGSKFCNKCGTAVVAGKTAEDIALIREGNSKRPLFITLAIVFAIAVVGVLAFFMRYGDNEHSLAATEQAETVGAEETPISTTTTTTPSPTPTPTPLPTPTPTPTSVPTITVIQFGNYIWRVLDESDGKILLLSEYIVEHRAYNEDREDVTWETCTLRSYLNNEFLYSFNESDRARIIEANIVNKDNPWEGASGGNTTIDRVFVLSIDELLQYFGDSGQLDNKPSAYPTGISDQYNKGRIALCPDSCPHENYYHFDDDYGKASWWWLRSPGYYSNCAADVGHDGKIGVLGRVVDDGSAGVRPALWLIID
jgi:hypothetical protein